MATARLDDESVNKPREWPGGEWWEMGTVVEKEEKKKNRKKKLTALQVRRLDSPFGQMINKDVWFYCSLRNQYSVFYTPFQWNKNQAPKKRVVLTWMMALGPSILDCDSRWKYEDTLKPTDSSQPLQAERLADLLTASSWMPLTATHIALHMSRTVWQSQLPILIVVLGFQGVFHVIVSDSVFCTRWCWRLCQVVQCVKTVIGMTILKRTMQRIIGVCNAMYNWILHRTPLTGDWKWICTISEITHNYCKVELPVKIIQ